MKILKILKLEVKTKKKEWPKNSKIKRRAKKTSLKLIINP